MSLCGQGLLLVNPFLGKRPSRYNIPNFIDPTTCSFEALRLYYLAVAQIPVKHEGRCLPG
jgi:hypothetical protein